MLCAYAPELVVLLLFLLLLLLVLLYTVALVGAPFFLLARRKVGASANKDAISLVALGAVIDDASSAGRQGVPF